MEKPFLSIVVPLFNERSRFPPMFQAIQEFIQELGKPVELILVDDGSSDSTRQWIDELSRRHSGIRVMGWPANRGKGAAVREGMKAAQGDIAVFIDGDGSTSPKEIYQILSRMNLADVFVGTRQNPEAKIVRHQPRLRELMGKVFTRLANALVCPGINDFTCGFKAFSRQSRSKIFNQALIDDWSFDAEILFLARKSGARMVEIPVEWHDMAGSKVRLGIDAVRSFWGLLRIRFNHWTGRYSSFPD